MKPHQDLIRECINPDCKFRFPESANSNRGITCPLCQAPTIVAGYAGYTPEWNCRAADRPEGARVEALLDNIRSIFNVGAMFRTADGAGLEHLHLCGLTPTPDHPKIPKTALGAENAVPWTYYRNSIQAASTAKERGMQIWALEVGEKAESLFDVLPDISNQPILLIVGNEVSGVDSGLLRLCDKSIWIPMQGFKRSLNVAVAFSIAVYFLRYANTMGLKR